VQRKGTNKVQTTELTDKITSRHIAKLLVRLGKTIEPVQESEIKRQMRFLAQDLTNVNNKEISANEKDTGAEVYSAPPRQP
jgi:hypothetical protein